MRILVVDGYDAAGRARQHEKFGLEAGIGYAAVIRSIAPEAETAIIRIADQDRPLSHDELRAGFDGVFLTGSSLHVWQGGDVIERQIEFARTVFASGLPFFGSCWGLQIATVAAGGVVAKNPRGREAGIARAITLTDAGLAHPMLVGRPPVFDAPCIHLDAVTRPAPGTIILAANANSDVQAAEIRHDGGTFWGVQYHPEFSLTHVGRVVNASADMHVDEARFASLHAVGEWAADLVTLDQANDREDLAAKHGISAEVTDFSRRVTELRNFIAARVRPYIESRAKDAAAKTGHVPHSAAAAP